MRTEYDFLKDQIPDELDFRDFQHGSGFYREVIDAMGEYADAFAEEFQDWQYKNWWKYMGLGEYKNMDSRKIVTHSELLTIFKNKDKWHGYSARK